MKLASYYNFYLDILCMAMGSLVVMALDCGLDGLYLIPDVTKDPLSTRSVNAHKIVVTMGVVSGGNFLRLQKQIKTVKMLMNGGAIYNLR